MEELSAPGRATQSDGKSALEPEVDSLFVKVSADAPWRLWLDPESPRALQLLMLDDMKGNATRPPLIRSLWICVASFLRFPAPMQMIYLLGGRRPSATGEEDCLATAEVFDWWLRDWVPLPPMSSQRVGAAAAVLGRLVVVAGGYSSRENDPEDSVEAYDPVEGQWLTLPPMPTRRYGLVLASSGDCLYAIGGYDGSNVTTANEVFDRRTATWHQVAPLPRPLAGGKAEAYDGDIYYVGGCDNSEDLSDAVYVYHPADDTWDHAKYIADDTDVAPHDVSVQETAHRHRINLRVARTSFAMALLQPPECTCASGGEAVYDPSGATAFAGGTSNCDGSSSSAHLIITGGVSNRTEELFLSDTELLQLQARGSAGTGAKRWSMPWIRKMSKPRSGCRSVVLWPTPQRPFLPWAADPPKEDPFEAGCGVPSPFVLVLGGETPDLEGSLSMAPCQEPAVLDLTTGQWHDFGSDDDTDNRSGRHGKFLDVVAGLRTCRVAFAITVARGLPTVIQHDDDVS